MTTTIIRFLIIAFSISCLLVHLYQCYPNPTATTTAITPKSTQNIDYEILKNIVADELNKNGKDDNNDDKRDKLVHDLEDIRRAKEKARARFRKSKESSKEHKESDDDDNDDDDNRSRSSIKSTSKQDKHSDDDDDKKSISQNSSKDGNAAHSTTPSNTVVTTIIIVSTETPTTIYSDSSSGSAKQKGDTSKGRKVDDPNGGASSSSTDNNGSTDSSSNNNAEQSQATAARLRDHSAYRKLVTALSIVGGIAGIALLAGGILFTRMKLRKRKREEADIETAKNNNHCGSQPPPPPPATATTTAAAASPPTSPHSSQTVSSLSNYNPRYGDDTLTGFNQDPFSDPADLSYSKHMIRSLDYRMSLTPTAPPSLPVNLESPRRFVNYQQNQIVTTALPSAPSAKELDALAYDGGNPFDDDEGFDITKENEQELERLGQPPHHRSHQSSITASSIASDDDISLRPTASPPLLSNMHDAARYVSTSSSTSSFHIQHQSHLQKLQASFSSCAELPPPAYTPSAPPSAPPLYALPISSLTLEAERQQQQQHQQQQQDEERSRRHSISSCSIASSARPLSLRRGSGSPAFYIL